MLLKLEFSAIRILSSWRASDNAVPFLVKVPILVMMMTGCVSCSRQLTPQSPSDSSLLIKSSANSSVQSLGSSGPPMTEKQDSVDQDRLVRLWEKRKQAHNTVDYPIG